MLITYAQAHRTILAAHRKARKLDIRSSQRWWMKGAMWLVWAEGTALRGSPATSP